MMGALWLSNHQLRNQVDIAYDRSLAGALRAIDHNISTASGGLAMEQPYLMLEFFELTANGSVFYRVATEDGLAEIGHPGLPMPAQPLVSGEPQFFYATYQGLPYAWPRWRGPWIHRCTQTKGDGLSSRSPKGWKAARPSCTRCWCVRSNATWP